jgi:hypothetical protein
MRIAAVAVSLAVLPLTIVLDAQQRSTTAVVAGAVLDPDRIPVADSVVFMTHVESGAQLQLVTGADGRFEFSGLAPGAYRLTSMTSGFGRIDLTLEAGDVIRRDIVLQFGPFQEAWMIRASASRGRTPAPQGAAGREWPCASRGLPFCGPPSLVAEFERDERERSGEPLLPPRPTRLPPMEYPSRLRDGKIEGRIVLTGRLSVDGVFEEMRVLSSDRPELEQPTLETLARVRWEPARLRGKSVAVPLTIGIRYVLTP